MSDGLSISERAIRAREDRYRARKAGSDRVDGSTRKPSRDPWYSAGPPGSWGRPDIDQGPRKAPDGLLERAMDVYGSLTRSDARFINLARRFNQFLKW